MSTAPSFMPSYNTNLNMNANMNTNLNLNLNLNTNLNMEYMYDNNMPPMPGSDDAWNAWIDEHPEYASPDPTVWSNFVCARQ